MGKWLLRLQSGLSFVLSLFSVLLALVFGLFQQMWYPLVVCGALFIALVVVLIVVESQRGRAPTEKMVDDLLAASVAPKCEKYPLCSRSAGTNASGHSVAALAAFDLEVAIRHIQVLLDKRRSEVAKETIFSEATLIFHLDHTRRIHAFLSGLQRSLAVQCARVIPEAERVYEDLGLVSDQIDSGMIRPMEILLNVLCNRDRQDSRIERQIHTDLANALDQLHGSGSLQGLESRMKGVSASMRDCWDEDREALWSDVGCRPKERPAPAMPPFLEGYLDRLAHLD